MTDLASLIERLRKADKREKFAAAFAYDRTGGAPETTLYGEAADAIEALKARMV